MIYPLVLVAKRLKRLSYRSQEKNADVMTRLTEVFNNNEIIKAHATEAFELGRFSKENWHFFKEPGDKSGLMVYWVSYLT